MSSEAPPHTVPLPASSPSRACPERPCARAELAAGESARIYLDGRDQQRPISAQDEGIGGAQPDLVSLHQRLEGYYRKCFTGQWQPCAVNGTFSVLAGIISLTLPIILDSSALAYAGGLLVVRGVLTLVSTLIAPQPGGFTIILLSSSLYLPAGICLMLNIFVEPISLIWFFAAYFVSTGIVTILLAIFHRRQYSGHWEWLLVSGVLNLDLALISLSRLPEHFIWILAIFLGLDLITYGIALLAVTLASNDMANRRGGA